MLIVAFVFGLFTGISITMAVQTRMTLYWQRRFKEAYNYSRQLRGALKDAGY